MRQAIALIVHHLVEREERQHAPAEMARNHSLAHVPTVTTSVRAGTPEPEAEASAPAAPKSSTRRQSLARLLSVFLGFFAMCVFAAAVSYTNMHYTNLNGDGDWTDGFALVAPLLSLFLDPLIILRNMFKSRTTHQLLRISIDGVIFLLGLVSLVYAIAGSIVWYWHDAIPNTADGSIDCVSPLNSFSHECAPIAYRIGHLQIAGAVFLTLLTTCHFGLGVMGVVNLLKSRKQENQRRLTQSFEMETANVKTFDLERGGSRDVTMP